MAAPRVTISFPPGMTLPELDGSNWATWSTAFDALTCLNGLRRHLTNIAPQLPAEIAPATIGVITDDQQAQWDAEEGSLLGLLMLNLTTEVWTNIADMTAFAFVHDKYNQLKTLYGAMGAMATFNLWVA
jgi:hypothetical protein